MLRSLAAISVISIAIAVAGRAGADIIQDWEFPELRYSVLGVPDFDQRRHATGSIPGLPGDGATYCGPTASADVLSYLASHTIGGLPGIIADSFLDYDSLEYIIANTEIRSCGDIMGVDADNGVYASAVSLGLENYLPPDSYSIAIMGGTTGDWIGLPIESIAYALCSPLFERPTAMGVVFWLRPDLITPGTWYPFRGHIFAIKGVRWSSLLANYGEIDIRDPDDSWRLWPAEPETSQSTFVSARYPVLNASFPMWWGETLTGGNMVGFSQLENPGLLSMLVVSYPTTIYSTDAASEGSVILTRPVRMEADGSPLPRAIAPALPNAATDLVFDFAVQRVFIIEGTGQSAKVKSLDGRGGPPTQLQTNVTPKMLASGRFGELMVFGWQGAVPVLETVRTAGQPASSFRTMPAMPEAVCYDDVRDVSYAWVAATRNLVAIPRDAAQQVTVYTVPTSILLNGAVDIVAEPGTGAVWLCADGQNGKLFRLVLGVGGTVDSISTAVDASIIAPRDLVALSSDLLVFGSGSKLRVLKKNPITGVWAAAMDSPLWGVSVGASLDISRTRSTFKNDDPRLDVKLDLPPDSPVTISADCDADLDLDGIVSGADLAILLSNWGMDGFGDLDQNDSCDGADLTLMLVRWGDCQ